MMEKKMYIAPQVEVVEMGVEVIMLSASNQIGVSDETTDADAVMGNGRRGTWGDRWE